MMLFRTYVEIDGQEGDTPYPQRRGKGSHRGMGITADDRKELERLRRQLEKVTAERDELLAENRRLRHDYSIGSQAPGKVSLPLSSMGSSSVAINNESLLLEKVGLFRSLFRGREDVFARLWWSRKSQRVGYSPVCRHEWNPAYCDKPRVKCGNCPNQDYTPVTDEVVQDHLEGRHTIWNLSAVAGRDMPFSGRRF